MNVALRPASPDDAPQVADVFLSSRSTFISYAPVAHAPAEVREWVARSLIPSGGVTVACTAERIVGMLAVKMTEDGSWIDQLYVAPGYVDAGIGGSLLRAAIASLRRPVRLYTFQANTGARRFYERYGFRAIQFSDGSANEELCPDVLYELR